MYSTNADINETCFAHLKQCQYIIHVQCVCTSLNPIRFAGCILFTLGLCKCRVLVRQDGPVGWMSGFGSFIYEIRHFPRTWTTCHRNHLSLLAWLPLQAAL